MKTRLKASQPHTSPIPRQADDDTTPLAAALLTQAFGNDVVLQQIDPISGGRNNRIDRVQTSCGAFVVKQYFQHANDPHDRLNAEWRFARLLWDGGVRNIPQPIVKDDASGAALFAWSSGRPLRAVELTEAHVDEAAVFVEALQSLRTHGADSIGAAAEACYSIDQHITLVQRRLERLARMDVVSDMHQTVRDWVESVVSLRWDQWLCRAATACQQANIDPAVVLPTKHRCLSPSDFGFHNALWCDAPPQNLIFLDFEYAGWDDPAKLVCDFFCQPQVPVPMRAFERFAKRVVRATHGASASEKEIMTAMRRARFLLPVYQFKWCCICLNEFLPNGRARRAHAGHHSASPAHLQEQFERAHAIFNQLEAFKL